MIFVDGAMVAPAPTEAEMARDWTTTGEDLLSDAGRRVAWHLAEGRCPVCDRRFYVGCADRKTNLTMDHVVAHANGGGCEGNLIPLCGSCNSSKRHTPLDEWLPARLLKIGRARSARGAARATTNALARLEQLRADLTTALIAEGIWAAAAAAKEAA